MSRAETKSRIGGPKRVTAGLCAGALAFAAPVSARPNTGPSWDIEAYDKCVKDNVEPLTPGIGGNVSWDYYYGELKICCLNSGGNWQSSGPGNQGKCVAPAGNQQGPPAVGGHDLTDLPQVTVNQPPG